MATTHSLEINIERTAGAIIVRLKGEASVQNVDELERQLRPVAASAVELVVIDLSGLSFISSLGLGTMVQFDRGIARKGGTVRFAGAQPLVRGVITKSKLDAVLHLCDSVEQALAAG
jgi:anti-sigma B factor antagonist